MRPLGRLRDPAPSRWAYRMHRLMLTPLFRLFLRVGLPVGCVLLAGSIYFADGDRREALIEGASDMRRQIEQRPEFMVNLMAIDGASDEVSTLLREVMPVDFPVSSFDLDLEGLQATVEEIDAVASASVRIRSGGVLQLDITERVPAVVWRNRDGLELLDAEGHRVAQIAERRARPDLVLLAGDGASKAVPEALALHAAAKLIEPRVRGLLRVGDRRWDVVLDRDQRILLPEEQPIAALERVVAMNDVQDLLERDVTVVDMRTPGRPVLRMSPDAATAYRDAVLMMEPARE